MGSDERMRDSQFDTLWVIATGPGTLGSNGANLLATEALRARAAERHWEAKWLQEKTERKAEVERVREEMARQAGVIEIQRRTEEAAKNNALRDLYEAQEKLESLREENKGLRGQIRDAEHFGKERDQQLEAAQKRIGELERRLVEAEETAKNFGPSRPPVDRSQPRYRDRHLGECAASSSIARLIYEIRTRP